MEFGKRSKENDAKEVVEQTLLTLLDIGNIEIEPRKPWTTEAMIKIMKEIRKTKTKNVKESGGTTVENKGKLILTEIFPSVQKHDIFRIETSKSLKGSLIN